MFLLASVLRLIDTQFSPIEQIYSYRIFAGLIKSPSSSQRQAFIAICVWLRTTGACAALCVFCRKYTWNARSSHIFLLHGLKHFFRRPADCEFVLSTNLNLVEDRAVGTAIR